jgi:hypothetical protein
VGQFFRSSFFVTHPEAPARMAHRAHSLSGWLPTTSAGVRGLARLIFCLRANPLFPDEPQTSSTTSHDCSRRRSMVLVLSSAWPKIAAGNAAPRICLSPCAKTGSSSTMRIRIVREIFSLSIKAVFMFPWVPV